jgi:hypothetical protein
MSSSAAVLPSRSRIVVITPLAEHRRAVRPQLALLPVPLPESGVEPPEPPKAADIQRVLTGVLEVLDGRRPAGQLLDVLPCKFQRALLTTALATGAGPRTLRSVHVSRTAVDILDLCARIEHSGRSRAMTGRMVVREGRWEFTLLAMV